MPLTPLTALSPLDGRYRSKVEALASYFSESGLIRYRIQVELGWLEALAAEPEIADVAPFPRLVIDRLRRTVTEFSEQDAAAVKAIETRIQHDVKAIEYWLREQLADVPEILRAAQFIHFACTSEDINNVSYALMVRDARAKVLLPALSALTDRLVQLAHGCAELPMLSRTHGQSATPTTLGKELANFAHRLRRQHARIHGVTMSAKFNGAVGNFNAHLAAYPNFDWERFARTFVEGLGLSFNPYTTQIEPHDCLTELFDACAAANTVVLALDRDLWGYVALGYFKQRVDQRHVGSSTMPHKVNPIDFENSEGNLGIANALLQHFGMKLPISRWQRDLSDSTVLRNVGVAFGHSLLAWEACARGLDKLEPNPEALAADLDAAWEVLAEPIQTVMRRHGLPDPYEQLRELTRGKAGIARETLHAFIRGLAIPEEDKRRLLDLTPASYIGLAAELARRI
jgi:adenylosuccinate lyase